MQQTFTVYCTLCKKALERSSLGIKSLQSHAKSEKHEVAVKGLQGVQAINQLCLAPSLTLPGPSTARNSVCLASSATQWFRINRKQQQTNSARMSFICHIHNYTEYNEEWNVFSAFNPSKCTHLEQWAADCAAPRKQSWTSCRSRDSNPQPWVTSGFKSNALSIRPTTAPHCSTLKAEIL